MPSTSKLYGAIHFHPMLARIATHRVTAVHWRGGVRKRWCYQSSAQMCQLGTQNRACDARNVAVALYLDQDEVVEAIESKTSLCNMPDTALDRSDDPEHKS